MRYFLTLPLAALAFSAVPAIAQDAVPPPEATTTTTPPAGQPTGTEAPVPPADPATTAPAPAPADTTAPTPAETVASSPPADTATPASPPTGLTAEQQASYDAWPAGTKTYFGALTPARQELFLRITDNDKAKLVALPASQQEKVWASLEKQAAAEPKG